MRIILSGGGTGGHFYPVIAVARKLKNLAEKGHIVNLELVYFSDSPYDKDLLRKEGIKFVKIPSGKIRRYFSLLNFIDPFKTVFGITRAFWNMFLNVPDVIFSKGGYAGFPAVVAGRLLKIPIIIHETDARPGKANLWSAKFADRISISFPEAIKYFPKEKTALTGNPIRDGIMGGSMNEAKIIFGIDESAPTMLFVGGSQGSEKINNILLEILPDLLKSLQVIHQCGRDNYKDVSQRASVILDNVEFKERYKLKAFLNEGEMRNSMFVSILAVSRASGGVIFELASHEIPSILIPLPNSAQNHQRENAYSYARTGSAEVIEENNLSSHLLLSEIKRLLGDKTKLDNMAKSAKAFAKIDAADKLAKEIIDLALKHAG